VRDAMNAADRRVFDETFPAVLRRAIEALVAEGVGAIGTTLST
jgi:hypothetical protein